MRAGRVGGDAAVAAGCTVSLDPASTGPLVRYGLDRWLADTAAATLLLPNADEARLLTGCRDVTGAASALAGRAPAEPGRSAPAARRSRAPGHRRWVHMSMTRDCGPDSRMRSGRGAT
ncbi:MAG: scrK [Modestobacter sp.]|nr:scrK [Modestobacter sp.]